MKLIIITIFILIQFTIYVQSEIYSKIHQISSFISKKIQKESIDDNEVYSLYKFFDRIVIKHPNGDAIQLDVDDDESSKVKCNLNFINEFETTSKASSKLTFHGIFGIYKLPKDYFIAIISDSSLVPDIPMDGIRKINKITLLKIPYKTSNQEKKYSSTFYEEQNAAKKLLIEAFQTHVFYYSTSSYDITHTFQMNHILKSNTQIQYDKSISETKYIWNLNNLSPLIEAKCDGFIIYVVNAWMATEAISYNGIKYNLTLLSRRSRRNQGPR